MKNIRYMKYVSFVLLLVFSLFLIHCSGGGGGSGDGDSGDESNGAYITVGGCVKTYPFNYGGEEPIGGAIVTFTDMKGKEIMRQTTDDAFGCFAFFAPNDFKIKEDIDCILKVEKAGYGTYTKNLTLTTTWPPGSSLLVYLATHDVYGDEHTAEGTWTYNAGTNVLTINWTSSDFPCHGPPVGTATKTVTITDTQMTWPGEMTWSHVDEYAPGQADNPEGLWKSTTASGTYYLDIYVDGDIGSNSGRISMRGITSACN